jgi:hypothetical protein
MNRRLTEEVREVIGSDHVRFQLTARARVTEIQRLARTAP